MRPNRGLGGSEAPKPRILRRFGGSETMFLGLEAVKPRILRGFTAFWARKSLPGSLREASGGLLGRSLAALGASWALLAALGRLLGRSWRLLGPSWVLLGRFWNLPGRAWGSFWPPGGLVLELFEHLLRAPLRNRENLDF